MLFQINEMRPAALPDFERDYHESLLIVLDTLEKCLSMQANLHPHSQGHGHQLSHMYSGSRGGIGRGPAYQQLKTIKSGGNGAAANLCGSSQVGGNQATESSNCTREKEVNSSES